MSVGIIRSLLGRAVTTSIAMLEPKNLYLILKPKGTIIWIELKHEFTKDKECVKDAHILTRVL